MREILFKAKRIDKRKWVEGYYQKRYDETERERHYIFWCKNSVTWEYAEVDEDTICQYTGLTDKNGNKIWENDIVKDIYPDVDGVVKFGEYKTVFDSSKSTHIGFYIDWEFSKNIGCYVNFFTLEVIGNIFDNPELLKGGADND